MLRFFALPSRIALATALALTAAACDINGIGKGTRPVSMEILHASGTTDPEGNVSYVCFTDQVRVIAYFNDNRQIGDFTSRQGLKLTSSDASVIEVSNGDIEVEGQENLVYSPGTLIPRGPGTAIITAQFSELSATYEVEVRQPQDFELTANRLAIAPNTLGALSLTAKLDGDEVNVTTAATWSFVEPEEESKEIALIGPANGIVAGLAPGQLKAKAEFPLCPTVAIGIEADVIVSPVDTLLLTREFAAPNDELVLNTTDMLKAVATLESGDTQDISTQASYTSADVEVVATGAAGVVNLARGAKVGVTTVTAVYTAVDPDPEDDDVDAPTVTSNAVPFTVVDDTIASLAITPEGATIVPGGSVQFLAEATYTVDPMLKQMVTRHVTWSSSDAENVGIGNGVANGGFTVAGTTIPAEPVDITAKFTIGTGEDAPTVEKVVKLCVVPLDVELPEDCPARFPADEDEDEDG